MSWVVCFTALRNNGSLFLHILVIKTSSLGDVIHTLPALTDARQAIPGIRFDWVVEESFAEVPAWHAGVERVIPAAVRRWRKNPFKAVYSGEWGTFCRAIGCKKYDAVIDAQGLFKSAWLTRFSHGESWGMDKFCAREPLASRFYQNRLNIDKAQHAVERVRQLFAKALGYPVPQGQGQYAIAASLSTRSTGNYLVFLHGTTRADKHWPVIYWKELARHYSEQGTEILLPWGNETERLRAEHIAQNLSGVKILPRSTLSELASIIGGARAVVSVDTGLAHLSAALDIPNITLYGPTDPGLVGTYGKNQLHLCATGMEAVHTAPSSVDPAIFAPLTPKVAHQALDNLLAGSQPS